MSHMSCLTVTNQHIVHCFTVCNELWSCGLPMTLTNFARGLSPQRRWERAPSLRELTCRRRGQSWQKSHNGSTGDCQGTPRMFLFIEMTGRKNKRCSDRDTVFGQALGYERDGTEQLRMPGCVWNAKGHEHTAEVAPVKSTPYFSRSCRKAHWVFEELPATCLSLERSDPHGPPSGKHEARVSLKNEIGQDFQGILETRSVDALKCQRQHCRLKLTARSMTAVAKKSNADRISALCFTACPQTGVLRSSDKTLCNFARGLSPPLRWKNAPCVCVKLADHLYCEASLNALSAKGRLRSLKSLTAVRE